MSYSQTPTTRTQYSPLQLSHKHCREISRCAWCHTPPHLSQELSGKMLCNPRLRYVLVAWYTHMPCHVHTSPPIMNAHSSQHPLLAKYLSTCRPTAKSSCPRSIPWPPHEGMPVCLLVTPRLSVIHCPWQQAQSVDTPTHAWLVQQYHSLSSRPGERATTDKHTADPIPYMDQRHAMYATSESTR